MKRKYLALLVSTLLLATAPAPPTPAAIPVLEVIKQGVIKVIKAIDLMIQRLQTKTIWLQNAAKTIENQLSKFKLEEIASWSEKQRQLYQQYYDELWKVRSTIATYHRISQIVKRQRQIVEHYQFTWSMVNQDKHFTKDEIDYMYQVYAGILRESVDNLEQVLLVVNAYKTQMTDARRLEIINAAGDRVEENFQDLYLFNQQAIQLSLHRAKDAHEIQTVKKLYGLE